MTATAADTLTVAVTGNPNTGKTTLFNALTGATQHVGNYPGVTVERRAGTCRLESGELTLLDLPGAYSLAAVSDDERIVLDVLTGRVAGEPRPDGVLCAVDATNIRRNLFLVSQVAELGLPIVIALTLSDEAEAKGIRIDVPRLSQRLGVPVVAVVASRDRGLDELRRALESIDRSAGVFPPVAWPDAVREAAAELAPVADSPAARHRLLFDTSDVDDARLREARARAHERMRAAGHDPVRAEALLRYAHIDALLGGVVSAPDPVAVGRGYRIDRVLTHRAAGLLAFAALMFVVFSSIYWLAQPLMNGVEWIFAGLSGWAKGALAGTPMFASLVGDGLIPGVGSVVIFLPQILILFLFIAILEDSGYMARAAFLMDKVFAWTGLNGKSFVPMLSSFACAVPSILATRTIEDRRARLGTILVSPLMSCSARLPVYVLMIGAFIQPRYGAVVAGAALFAMHALGLVVSIPIAYLVNRFLLKLRPIPFILEMPPYRRPLVRSVALKMYLSGREFLVRAGTVIFAFSIVIWGLTYYPRPAEVRERIARAAAEERGVPVEEARRLLETELAKDVDAAYLEQSWLGRFGKLVQPAFAPAGFDWKITVGVLAAFPAREVVVSTLGIIYSLDEGEREAGEESAALRQKLASAHWPDGRPVYTTAVAVAVMVFFAFCMQCGSTVAVVAREAGWKWAAFTFAYMTGLAWVGAVAVYQIGSRIG